MNFKSVNSISRYTNKGYTRLNRWRDCQTQNIEKIYTSLLCDEVYEVILCYTYVQLMYQIWTKSSVEWYNPYVLNT